ncbi:TPA: hypothetical protein HA235_04420 [Candidatus Woesearchaeota archaeon]|nr:hypothetical protein [Candidatus Woesearchaeota archaeon]HIH31927.1 hypothetical protein [Candidatus Woesearchaeota archaeon]HIH55503.1 hypothetical protein [Candidatus Woesearchaeota archaeon]HIJ01060.1 hypothetical protein [Candidatus Woesearchaeota archaeon]HIJ14715.1 hypothetical protein [Candidatus Woesearchaeota archaeon]
MNFKKNIQIFLILVKLIALFGVGLSYFSVSSSPFFISYKTYLDGEI